jgi:two-component system sensor histidine kinase SenX3
VKNLVENAIKYTPEGGAIGLEARNDAESVIVEVSDTGIGIAEAEHEKIFERFYRVDASRGSGGGGSGLGLALVKDIASFFGGGVELKSEPGKGSTFTLRLPINLPEE